eukprot:6181531-Pleurochrysis_carterae.AAC.2
MSEPARQADGVPTSSWMSQTDAKGSDAQVRHVQTARLQSGWSHHGTRVVRRCTQYNREIEPVAARLHPGAARWLAVAAAALHARYARNTLETAAALQRRGLQPGGQSNGVLAPLQLHRLTRI